MSGNSDSKTGAAAPPNAMAEMWATLFEQSNQQARAMLEMMKSAGDPQGLQRRWLDAMAQTLDSFMRTPAFLEAMQQNLKMMADLKTTQDRFLQDSARQLGLPLAADVTGLFERINSVEQTILGRLKAIEAKLKTLDAKHEAPVATP
jgi:ribosomal protein L16 Arg81 hydroxylase